MRRLPFEEYISAGGIRRRVFRPDTRDDELIWHRDRRDRRVTVREGEGWHLQFDDELPQPLVKGCAYSIPAGIWHRVLRESPCTQLIVDIEES